MMIALIPARAGSRRVPGKNTRLLAGHPLLAYSIAAARESGLFESIWLSSNDEVALQAGIAYGARLIVRPDELATDDSPDIAWVEHALRVVTLNTTRPDMFAILRPTSPFRTAETITRASAQFMRADQTAHSLRAVQPAKEHPGKMWTWRGPGYPMEPLLPRTFADGTPWHSSPTQSLPRVYVQNSSLEISWTANVEAHHSISGWKIIPFFTEWPEGLAIDSPAEFAQAEGVIAGGLFRLPEICPRLL